VDLVVVGIGAVRRRADVEMRERVVADSSRVAAVLKQRVVPLMAVWLSTSSAAAER
jgi:hypothetical protein